MLLKILRIKGAFPVIKTYFAKIKATYPKQKISDPLKLKNKKFKKQKEKIYNLILFPILMVTISASK